MVAFPGGIAASLVWAGVGGHEWKSLRQQKRFLADWKVPWWPTKVATTITIWLLLAVFVKHLAR